MASRACKLSEKSDRMHYDFEAMELRSPNYTLPPRPLPILEHLHTNQYCFRGVFELNLMNFYSEIFDESLSDGVPNSPLLTSVTSS